MDKLDLKNVKVISFDAFETILKKVEPTFWIKNAIEDAPEALTEDKVIALRRDLVCANRPIMETLKDFRLLTLENTGTIAAMIRQETSKVAPVQHSLKLVKKLSDIYQIAVVSNLGYDFGKPVLAAFGHLIDYPIFSYHAGCTKPASKIFQMLITQSGVRADEIVHIGNSYKNDYVGAKNAGMHAIHLDLKGDSAAEHKISSLEELAKYL